MKIDGQTPRIDTTQIDRSAKAGERATGTTGAAGGTGATDQLSLSPEAQLAPAAPEQAPAIRADVVDRMKALLDQGKVGSDPGKLADALIDHWLESKS